MLRGGETDDMPSLQSRQSTQINISMSASSHLLSGRLSAHVWLTGVVYKVTAVPYDFDYNSA
jgi:hypothetical protein